MDTKEEIFADRSAERVARVSARYESERRFVAATEPASPEGSRGVIETPCELAPAVLRRFVRRRPK